MSNKNLNNDAKNKRVDIAVVVILIVLFIISIVATISFAKEFKVKKANYDKIKGMWYSLESNGFEETFRFNEGGKAVYNLIDLDRVEDIEENKGLEEAVSAFTYTFKDNKGVLSGNFETFDFEYIEDGDKTKLKLTDVDNKETITYYRNEDIAKEKSDYYKRSLAYIMEIADEDGWAIKKDTLLGYIGKEKKVTIPKKVKTIETSAFSADLGRGEKLNKIVVPGTVKKIEAGAFAYTEANTVIIKEGVKEIGDNCFIDSFIDEIHFPKSINKIGSGIMESEEGLNDCVIYVVKGSAMDKHFKKYSPYGDYEVKYE